LKDEKETSTPSKSKWWMTHFDGLSSKPFQCAI